MSKLFASLIRAAAIGLLMYAGVASGAIYRQHIDPAIYGGDGLFDIDPDCIRSGTEWIAAGTGGCGPVDILDILVTTDPGVTPVGTIRFAPPILEDNFVTGLLWINGVLRAIDTQTLFSVSDSGSFDNPGGYTLQYFSGHFGETDGLNPEGPPPTADVLCVSTNRTSRSTLDTINDPGRCAALAASSADQFPAVLVAAVPEPGSLALIVGAMGAGWLSRRKSRKT
jgi:PEP-CTERM motif-containing protein